MSPDGTASFTGSVGITRASLSDGEIDNDDNVPYDYRWSDAQVKINNREVEEKIRSDGDKWPLDVFDAGGRAKYMNRALQTGLINAATQVTYEGRPAVPATMWSLAKFSVITAGYKYGFDFTTEQAAGVYLAFVNGLSGLQHLAVKKDEDYKRLGEPKRLWTASPYIRYDRFTASVAMSANSKLIRESKVKS